MSIEFWVIAAAVLCLATVGVLALYRLIALRRGGTAALVRVLPAEAGAGWRHGLIRYGEDSLVFFKLTSLRPGPDARIRRGGLEIEQRRGPRGDEYDIMTDEIVVVAVNDGHADYELALDRGAAAAFLSWVESKPPRSGRY